MGEHGLLPAVATATVPAGIAAHCPEIAARSPDSGS